MTPDTSGPIRTYLADDGRRFAAITSVLGWVYRKPEWLWPESAWSSDSARAFFRLRGRLIHKACYLVASGSGVKRSSLDPEFRGSVLQFEKALRELNAEVLATEDVVRSERLRVAGRRDLKLRAGWVGLRRRVVVTCDIKTGAEDPLAGPQTYAYASLEREALQGDEYCPEVEVRLALYLSNDGYRIRRLDDPRDKNHWLNAVAAYRSAEAMKLLKRQEDERAREAGDGDRRETDVGVGP